MLFTAAKVTHMNNLKVRLKDHHTLAMVSTMDAEGFGGCTNVGEYEAVCPKGIALDMIAQLNRDYATAQVKNFFEPVN